MQNPSSAVVGPTAGPTSPPTNVLLFKYILLTKLDKRAETQVSFFPSPPFLHTNQLLITTTIHPRHPVSGIKKKDEKNICGVWAPWRYPFPFCMHSLFICKYLLVEYTIPRPKRPLVVIVWAYFRATSFRWWQEVLRVVADGNGWCYKRKKPVSCQFS